MKIWFGTTTSELLEYKDYYFAIRDYLIESNCTVLFDWLETAMSYRQKNPTGKRNIKGIYEEICQAIDIADAVIIEYTVPNFSSSDQINQAIYKKKPTLVLRLHRDNTYSDSYIEAIDSPYLTLATYSLENYKKIIDEFLGYSRLDRGMKRYNIVLDKKHKHFLDVLASKERKSVSALLRELVEERMKQQ